METYVISGELAVQFKRWLVMQDQIKIKDFIEVPDEDAELTITEIRYLVSQKYLQFGDSIDTNSNIRDYVRARQIAWYLARKLTRASLPMLGRIFNKHHTTVKYGAEIVRKRFHQDPEFAAEIKELEDELKKRRAAVTA